MFDGDTCSFEGCMSNEAINEITLLLKQRKSYIEANGEFRSSVATDTVKYVLHNMTGD